MESSGVVFFRAFVMLACLIVVPLAAILGSAFPEVVKSVLIDRFVSTEASKTEAAPAAPASFYTPGQSSLAGGAGPSRSSEMAPAWGGAANNASSAAWP